MSGIQHRGVARIYQRGGGGHTVSNIIVMAFSPRNIVGCLLKKRLTKGGGHGLPRTPLATPLQHRSTQYTGNPGSQFVSRTGFI